MIQRFHSWYLPNKNESICPEKHLYINIHSSFIADCQKLEKTQMSVHQRMNKQNEIQPFNEKLLRNKNE